VRYVGVNNTAVNHVASARPVLIVDANSVKIDQNPNKYIYKTI